MWDLSTSIDFLGARHVNQYLLEVLAHKRHSVSFLSGNSKMRMGWGRHKTDPVGLIYKAQW